MKRPTFIPPENWRGVREPWMGDFFAYRAHTKIRWWHWLFSPYYGALFVAVIAIAIWYNVVAHHHLNLDPTWKRT